MSSALPLDRIYESQGWVAFRHPHPSYPFHVLLVPKCAIPSLTSLKDDDAPLLAELVGRLRSLLRNMGLRSRAPADCQRRAVPRYPPA